MNAVQQIMAAAGALPLGPARVLLEKVEKPSDAYLLPDLPCLVLVHLFCDGHDVHTSALQDEIARIYAIAHVLPETDLAAFEVACSLTHTSSSVITRWTTALTEEQALSIRLQPALNPLLNREWVGAHQRRAPAQSTAHTPAVEVYEAPSEPLTPRPTLRPAPPRRS